MTAITNTINKLEAFIYRMSGYSTVYLLLFVLIGDITVSCIFSFLLFPDHSSGFQFSSLTEEFILAVLFAPIFETLIFQALILKKSLKYFNNNKLVAIILSASLFGLSHYYSIPYVIKATLAGVLYGLLYFVLLNKNKQPIIYIIIVHAMYNLIGFKLNNL